MALVCRMWPRWTLFALYWLACQVRVVIGNLGLLCYVPCYKSGVWHHLSPVNSLCYLLQDSFEVRFSLAGESLQSNTSCTASPCEFSVGGVPGQLYAVSVYAVQQTFRSDPAVVEHNTGVLSFLLYQLCLILLVSCLFLSPILSSLSLSRLSSCLSWSRLMSDVLCLPSCCLMVSFWPLSFCTFFSFFPSSLLLVSCLGTAWNSVYSSFILCIQSWYSQESYHCFISALL